MKKGSFFLSPYFVMSIVLLMYFAKVVTKIGVGTHIHSPVITGDGYHNVADIFQAFLVIVVILYARMPHGDEYPFGRKNVESIFSFAVGLLLCVTAFQLAFQCITGFIESIPVLSTYIHLSRFRGQNRFSWVLPIFRSWWV
ncbi:MAG: cation transporter [Parcubacteria group bacterium]|nr:cation transporter [Parcubacteria group bacterium]